jgi:hypothetical protein
MSDLDHTPHNLSELTSIFTEEEISKTVMSSADGKSVGPEVFPNEFYQQYWPIIKGEIISLVQAFYRNELDLWRLDRAFITVIPKKKGPLKYRTSDQSALFRG